MVALIQVSPPDRFGYCSLGVSVDITRFGDGQRPPGHRPGQLPDAADPGATVSCAWMISTILWFRMSPWWRWCREKRTRRSPAVSAITFRSWWRTGATLQVGFGHLPNAILKYLDKRRDLGLHTQLITDGMMPLFEKGVITNKKKTLLPGRAVASLCMGSEALYRFVDNHPGFYFRSSDFVNNPTEIARNDNLISISSALEVDLTGQVCTDSMGYLFYSGIGDQVDFIRGSAMSKGGFSIIALPSTAQNGKVSRIVPHLSEGAGVATTRADVNFVVTEYGIAELKGKGIYQRVVELAQIAHPKFREELIEMAKKRHYIFADQLTPTTEDLIFIEGYKSAMRLKNGKTIDFRPLLPSDEFAFRNFFYSLQEKTIYYRFFYKMKLFSHEVVQKQWASVDYRKNMSLIGLVQKGGHQEIMAIGSYAMADEATAEVAFVVREDYQGQGVASYLLGELERIAKLNEYKKV